MPQELPNYGENVFLPIGAERLRVVALQMLLVVAASGLAFFIARFGAIVAFAFIGAMLGSAMVYALFRWPLFAVGTAFSYSFLVSLIERYAKVYAGLSMPWGLGVDFLLVIAVLSVLINGHGQLQWQNFKNSLVALALIWVFFTFMQVLNPAAPSLLGWIFTIRQYSLYLIFVLIVGLLFFNQTRHFRWFLALFFVFSIVGSIWGIKQLHFGLSYVDQIFILPKWDRHMLFGKLRVFSIYDNAGQAGASQGHAAVVATILALHERHKKWKWFYIITALFTFYGMAISGTRGALAVPLVGMGLYLALSRKTKIQLAGAVALSVTVYILAFTNIGQSNYTVNRMRTAFNPDDPSLQYRLKAREGYQDYLNAKPFGWGLGTAGYWGARFLGDKNVMGGTDGGYVQIQAETGIVGVAVYLLFYVGYVLLAIWRVLFMPNCQYRWRILALIAGVCGLLLANYGNSVTFQFPSGLLVPFSLLFIEVQWQRYKRAAYRSFV